MMDGWKDELMDGLMGRWMVGQMDGCRGGPHSHITLSLNVWPSTPRLSSVELGRQSWRLERSPCACKRRKALEPMPRNEHYREQVDWEGAAGVPWNLGVHQF